MQSYTKMLKKECLNLIEKMRNICKNKDVYSMISVIDKCEDLVLNKSASSKQRALNLYLAAKTLDNLTMSYFHFGCLSNSYFGSLIYRHANEHGRFDQRPGMKVVSGNNYFEQYWRKKVTYVQMVYVGDVIYHLVVPVGSYEKLDPIEFGLLVKEPRFLEHDTTLESFWDYWRNLHGLL